MGAMDISGLVLTPEVMGMRVGVTERPPAVITVGMA